MSRLAPESAERRAERDTGTASRADYSEALDRGLAILRAFGPNDPRLTQADLSRKLGLPRATVRRAVLTLQHMGYLEADGRAFRLTPQILTLASTYLTANPVSAVIQPHCERLAARFDTSSTVAVLDGADAVMIARAVPRHSLAFGHGIGFRVPVADSALGRVLLAGLPDDERRSYATRLPAGDDGALEELLDALAAVADRGHAYVADRVEPGFHSIAVPLRRWDGRVVAALNVGARIHHLSASGRTEAVLPELRDTAATVQPQLI